jgi:broad specificity phosphatase PhoE
MPVDPGPPAALLAVRHGQSTGNVANHAALEAKAERLELETRDMDVPLSPLGREQAAALGRWLHRRDASLRPTAVLSSPYQRAMQTARLALDSCGGAVAELPVVVDERLRDRDLGVFDGLTWHGVQVRHPELAAARTRIGKFYMRPPGGESWTDVLLRLRSLHQTLLQEYAGERVLVFTHDVVVVLLRYLYDELDEAGALRLGATEPVANCSVTTFVRRDGRLRLESYNQKAPAEENTPTTAERDQHAANG